MYFPTTGRGPSFDPGDRQEGGDHQCGEEFSVPGREPAETRRKEISLRKVLGSSVPQVIFLLSRSFLFMQGIAVIISVPIAYFLNSLWLQFFVSRVPITPLILLENVLVLAAICFFIVFSQAWRISTTSLSKSLRMEG